MYEMKSKHRSLAMLPKLIVPFLLLTASLHAVPVFIGTTTGKNTASKGIYLADFDSATGKLGEPVLAAEYQNPGFLALHPTKPVLYACGQPNQPFADGTASVAAFSIGQGQLLKFLGESSVGGKGSCHLAVDATGRTAAIANYGDGSLSTVRLGEDGIPGAAVSVIFHHGSGPNKGRQEGAHAHGVYFDKANTHLISPDLGLDQVFVYPFDAATSKLGEPLPSLTTAPGAGPRHLTFAADEKNAYVINELDGTLITTTYEAGKFKVIGTQSTLPRDFADYNKAAEVAVHPNGKFVYGSNRGHDSIVVFRRDETTGILTFLQHAPCGGKTPRHFVIDPAGKWLLCAHQDSNTISVLPLDPATGLLGQAICTVPSPSPICLLFGREK